MHSKSNLYNNADSFSMAFDEAWKSNQVNKLGSINKEEKLKLVLESIKDHPFLIESKKEAELVANFRIRLLDLK